MSLLLTTDAKHQAEPRGSFLHFWSFLCCAARLLLCACPLFLSFVLWGIRFRKFYRVVLTRRPRPRGRLDYLSTIIPEARKLSRRTIISRSQTGASQEQAPSDCLMSHLLILLILPPNPCYLQRALIYFPPRLDNAVQKPHTATITEIPKCLLRVLEGDYPDEPTRDRHGQPPLPLFSSFPPLSPRPSRLGLALLSRRPSS